MPGQAGQAGSTSIDAQAGQAHLAGRPYRPRERLSSLLRFSHAGTNEALALPALKRVIRVETLSQSAKALLPHMNAGAPTC